MWHWTPLKDGGAEYLNMFERWEENAQRILHAHINENVTVKSHCTINIHEIKVHWKILMLKWKLQINKHRKSQRHLHWRGKCPTNFGGDLVS